MFNNKKIKELEKLINNIDRKMLYLESVNSDIQALVTRTDEIMRYLNVEKRLVSKDKEILGKFGLIKE